MSKQIGVYKQYSPSKLASAVKMVETGAMSKKKAALTFNVPRSTLIDKLSGKAPLGKKSGRSTVLTEAEENVLADYCKLMANIGYPLKRLELMNEVKRVLEHDGRTTPFKNNTPGKDWYYGFCKRHPDITERNAMVLGYQRSLINEEMLQQWFKTLEDFMEKEVVGWETMIRDPRRIFNADESGFPLCVNTGKVLAERGMKHVYQVSSNNKQQITVMACFNAIGNYLPPLIVYPGERFRDSGIADFPEALYGHTKNGWMDSSLFVEFLKLLNKFVIDKEIPKPVILYVDGHSTHMTHEASRFCNDNEIILYCLLPNATHILQACDVGLFGPMKAVWKKQVKLWHVENLGVSFSKKNFPSVFKKTWREVTKIENAIHAFERCGLFPLNYKAIDMTKLNPSKVHKTEPANSLQIQSADIDNVEVDDVVPAQIEPTQPVAVVDRVSEQTEPVQLVQTQPVQSTSFVTNFAPVLSDPENPPSQIVNVDRNATVSGSFSLLTVPEIRKTKNVNSLRKKLPKALSGNEALQMLKEREERKIAEENAKKRRKEEREQKRKEKQEEKERKQKEREEKRKRRHDEPKKQKVSSKKKCYLDSSSSSEESGNEPMLCDTDDDFDERVACPGCTADDGDDEEWVKCSVCPRRWHISCTGDAILFELTAEQLKNYPFVCEYCI